MQSSDSKEREAFERYAGHEYRNVSEYTTTMYRRGFNDFKAGIAYARAQQPQPSAEVVERMCIAYNQALLNQPEHTRNQVLAMQAALSAISPQRQMSEEEIASGLAGQLPGYDPGNPDDIETVRRALIAAGFGACMPKLHDKKSCLSKSAENGEQTPNMMKGGYQFATPGKLIVGSDNEGPQ